MVPQKNKTALQFNITTAVPLIIRLDPRQSGGQSRAALFEHFKTFKSTERAAAATAADVNEQLPRATIGRRFLTPTICTSESETGYVDTVYL